MPGHTSSRKAKLLWTCSTTLLALAVLAGCSACSNVAGPANPTTETGGWPVPPLKILLDRNWQYEQGIHNFAGYAVVGQMASSAYQTENGRMIDFVNLKTGERSESIRTVGGYEGSPFTDGTYIYAWTIAESGPGSSNLNHLTRWNPDGSGKTSIYLTTDDLLDDYKNDVLNKLVISTSNEYSRLASVQGAVLYWSTQHPMPEDSSGGIAGGLYSVDLSELVSTGTAGEYAAVVKLVHQRTNNLTDYAPLFAFFEEEGESYIVFAEIFQAQAPDVYQFDDRGERVYQLEYARENLGLHCIDLATGQERWKYIDDYSYKYVRLFDFQDLIVVSNGEYSHGLDKRTGQVRWSSDPDVGNSGMLAYAFDTNTMYINKPQTNSSTGLEAVNLGDGKRKWARYQYATQGHGIALHQGILYVVNQTAVRLYRASDGFLLAADDSIVAETGFSYPNQSFVWGDDFIIYGDEITYSIKMNYELDIFGNLHKKGPV